MSADRPSRLLGADESVVRSALETGDPLPGTAGFAGRLDGLLVRDVLGRQPLFHEAGAVDPAAGATDPAADGAWSFDRRDLDDPMSVPAGQAVGPDGPERRWSLPSPEPRPDHDAAGDRDAAVAAVGEAIADAVGRIPADGTAIAFSGGVDSAAIAARLDAPLYVAGFPDSHDVAAARSAAAALDRDVTVVELAHEDLVAAVPDVVAATGRANAMDVSIALPLVLTANRVAADGHDRLVVGQGADELFGGYAKVANAPDDHRVDADSVAGARDETLAGLPDQLERDVLAIRSAGVEPVAPYLRDEVVRAALALPGDALVTDDGVRKWALRRAVGPWLPDAVATRDKKAMQYGSLVSRELDRLARQAGFKRRMDDHVGQYVDSLVAESNGN